MSTYLYGIHLNFRFRVCFEEGVPWHSGTTEYILTLKCIHDMIITFVRSLRLVIRWLNQCLNKIHKNCSPKFMQRPGISLFLLCSCCILLDDNQHQADVYWDPVGHLRWSFFRRCLTRFKIPLCETGVEGTQRIKLYNLCQPSIYYN